MKKILQLLICEDVESDAAMIIRVLEKSGYEVCFRRIETAEDMRLSLKSQPWDIIISDFNIPGFGGPEALAVLRSTGIDIPFVLISGTIGEEIAVTMMRAGANDYLMKDSLTRLGEVVKRELEEAINRREWKAAAEQVKANEEKYHAVIDNSMFAIFLARPKGRIMESNRAARELFGYTEEEFLNIRREQLLDHSDPLLEQKLEERDKNGHSSGEFIGIKKNGEKFHCGVSSIIFKDIKGQEMTCSMLADISPRKNAEQKLHNTNNELKKLSNHLKNAREDERKYISREIHDQLGQLASALKIELDWLSVNVPGLEERAASRIEHAVSITKIMIDTTRKIATALRPGIIDELGLNASLKWQCSEFQNLNAIECVFNENFDDKEVDLEVRTELFRICQESLTNVMRHANASRVEVFMNDRGEKFELSINDNGKGFDTRKKSSHIGLIGVRERASSINGVLQVESDPGNGTTIRVIIPKNKSTI